MSEHTPGPWSIIDRGPIPWGRYAIEYEYRDDVMLDHVPIAEVDREPDARLIIAAPDLLATCQLMLDFYHMNTDEFVAKYGTGISTRTLGDRARAAIAKARGEGVAA